MPLATPGIEKLQQCDGSCDQYSENTGVEGPRGGLSRTLE